MYAEVERMELRQHTVSHRIVLVFLVFVLTGAATQPYRKFDRGAVAGIGVMVKTDRKDVPKENEDPFACIEGEL